MTGYATFVYRQPGAGTGAVVGVVEVYDAALRVVAQRVLRCGQPDVVELPTGRYLAHATLPSGARTRVAFTAGPDTVVELPHPAEAPARSTPAGWLLAWRHHGTRWSPSADLEVSEPPSGGIEAVLPGHGDSTSAALLIGGGAPAVVTVAPADVALRVDQAGGAEAGWRVAPAPGAESTLLAYLHRDELAAARTVGEEVLREAPEPGLAGGALLDVILGYHLLRTGDERLHDWVPALVWHQPFSVDGAILHAWQQMRGRAPSVAGVRAELLRATATGLPVLASGLRLLASGLSLLDGDPRAGQALARLRPHLLACRDDAALTTFTGAAPDAPGQPLTARPVSTAVRAFGHLATRTVHSEHAGRPEAPAAPLAEPLPALPETPLDPHTPARRLPVGDRFLAVTVTPARGVPGAFDVRLEASGGGAWAGATAVLRADPLHYLATFDRAGTASFHAVPSGGWRLRVPPRRTGRRTDATAYTLPPVRAEQALVAAPPGPGREVLRAVTPEGRADLIVWAYGSAYALEVITTVEGAPVLVAVDYETDAGTAALVIPLAAATAGPSSGFAWLAGFRPDRPWTVSEPANAAELVRWSTGEITTSARSATPVTHRAWRLVAALADPSYRQAIEEGLQDE